MEQSSFSNQLLTALIGFIGVLVGFFLKALYDYFQSKKDRYDKYYFAMLNKRFEVYQEAYNKCEELKLVTFKEVAERAEVVSKAREWYDKNNLYLSPDIRNLFNDFIRKVDSYQDFLNGLKEARDEKGWDSDEANQRRQEIKDLYLEINFRDQEILTKDIDKYYEILDNKTFFTKMKEKYISIKQRRIMKKHLKTLK